MMKKTLTTFGLLALASCSQQPAAAPPPPPPPPPALTAPVSTVAPTLSGTARVGQRLTVSNGSWSGTAATSYSYAWQRCDSTGANCTTTSGTASSYSVTSADVGFRLRATVTASNAAGSGSATSAVSAVVVAKNARKAKVSQTSSLPRHALMRGAHTLRAVRTVRR